MNCDVMAQQNMDLKWRNETLIVRELCNIYAKFLPIVIRTVEGYCGVVEEESLSIDDVSCKTWHVAFKS